MLKIVMISRATLFSSVGGDTIQMLNTAKYLGNLDVEVDIATTDSKIDYHQYDLLHFFNIIRPADIIPHVEASGLPFVVSTIYVDYSEYERRHRKGLPGFAFRFLSLDQIEYIKALARKVLNGEAIRSNKYLLIGHRRSIRWVAKKAALLLPNSASEEERFFKNYGIATPCEVIPNAIDPALFDLNATPDTRFTDHVLTVARVEGRKNQLNVIRAVLETNLKLDVIGNYSPNHKSYHDACLSEAQKSPGQVSLYPHIDQEKLVPIYRAAKVHVLASWFETTGLTSLEAALMGCNVVITRKGDTVEYFGKMAFYCEPDDVKSIQSAIFDAHAAPFSKELRQRILTHYTWEIAAQKTYDAYQKVLKR